MRGIKLLILLLIVIVGAAARMKGILGETSGFTYDQGRDLIEATKIIHGNLTFIGPTTGMAGLFHGPLWYWILAVFVLIGKGDMRVILTLILLLFILGELYVFSRLRRYYGELPAYLFIFFCSFSPFLIGQNIQLWSPSMIILSAMLTAGATVGIINGEKRYWLLGVFLGFGIQFEMAGGILLLLAITVFFSIAFPIRENLRNYLKVLGGFLLTLTPQILFEMRHGFLMTKNVIRYSLAQGVDIVAETGVKKLEYKTGLFLDLFDRSFFSEKTIFTICLLSVLFFLSILSIKRGTKFPEKVRRLAFLVSVIVFSFWAIVNIYSGTVWGHFMNSLFVFYMFGAVLALSFSHRLFPKTVNLIIGVLVFTMLFQFALNFRGQRDVNVDGSYYKSKLFIVDEIYKDAGNSPFNVVIYDPTTYPHAYDYLLTWYGKKYYMKEPVSNESRQKLVYYIIEPDNIEGRQEKWVAERDGDGMIIWQKLYWPNPKSGRGVIFQKRLREI